MKIGVTILVVICAIAVLDVTAITITGIDYIDNVTTIDVSSQWTQHNRGAIHCVDGSGLDTTNGYHGTDIWTDLMWSTIGGSGTVHYIVFDLRKAYNLKEVRIWNYNELGATKRGVKDFKIWVSTDNSSWTDKGSFVLSEAPGSGSVDYSETFAINTDNIRYVKFTTTTSYGEDELGLAEVAFREVPEPTTIGLLAVGVLGLLRKK